MRSPLVSRRHLIGWCGGAGLLGVLSRIPHAKADDDAPHFLLAVHVNGGVDNTYVFDARHRKLTEKNLKQNYLLANDALPNTTRPDEFTDEKLAARTLFCERTGCTALRSPFVDALWEAHGDCLSIVNGVHMLRGDIGHPSNQAYFWSNGTSMKPGIFPPIIGARQSMPAETIALGFSSNVDNLARSLVTKDGVDGITALGAGAFQLDPSSPLGEHLFARAEANAVGDGMFAAGSGHLANGMRASSRLAGALAALSAAPPEGGAPSGSIAAKVATVLKLFQSGVTRVASIVQSDIGGINPDIHAASPGQKDTIPLFRRYAEELTATIALLKNTTFVDRRGRETPFIDVTTFVVASEFGRTNRTASPTTRVGATGTDHNTFSNSILLGGKGIVGGLVVGESDLRDCDDAGVYRDVSGAHRQLDPRMLQIMGRPFDFEAQRLRTDLPSSFAAADVIGMPSVTNTLFDAFGVPREQHYKIDGRAAPVLRVLRRGGA